MKIKNYSLKILSLAISLTMLLSVASIPAMAVDLGVAYENVTISATTYTLEQFKADFSTADYAAVETFEDSANYTPTGSSTAQKAVIKLYPISGGEDYCELTLDRATANNVKTIDSTSSFAKAISSGGTALGFTNMTKGLTFSIGEIANNPALQPVAFGWASGANGSNKTTLSIKVSYSNGVEDTINFSLAAAVESKPQYPEFVGFKAPEGAYITDINMSGSGSRSVSVDDVAIIFEEFSAPEEITVTTEADTVAEPQYNATKTVQFVACDAETSNAYEDVNWYVEGVGATIDANGLVTLTRTEDTSIAGEITVTAKVKSDETISETKKITVTEAEPYFEAARMSDGALTSYTRNDFVADLNAADHKAVINFENTEYTKGSGNIAFTPAVSEDGGTFGCTLQAYNADGEKNTAFGMPNPSSGKLRFQKRNTDTGYYAIELDGANLTDASLEPTAVGMMLGNSGNTSKYGVRIYLNGETEAIDFLKTFSAGDKTDFIGYKAPGGRYIEKIELEIYAGTDFDDLCFILENPEDAPIKFSTDEAATDIIGSLTDVTGDIYINVAANAFSGKKVLLALYGGDELLDVAMVDASETEAVQTKASRPEGKTLTTVKAFVWNFNELVPFQNDIIIDK